MNRLSTQVQMYVAIGLIAVLGLAFVFLAIVPKFQTAADVNQRILTAETDLQSAQALLARRQAAKSQAAASEVELMDIANQMPDSPQLPGVVVELQELANSAGVTLGQISVGEITAPAPGDDGVAPTDYNLIEINATVIGDWGDAIDFYRRLEKLDRGVRVTTSSVTNEVEEDEENPLPDGFVQATVTLEVYVMSPASSGVGTAP